MQEQPPSDPPRREPAATARRSRSIQPTFTPPPAPVPPADQAGADAGPAPRLRRGKAAPTVLFQPPEPAPAGQSAGAPGRTPGGAAPASTPRPRPAVEGASNAPARNDTVPVARKAVRTRRVAEPAEDGPDAGAETTKPTKRATAKKAAPAAKKAAPAARKRAGRPPTESAEASGDASHTVSPAPQPATTGASATPADAPFVTTATPGNTRTAEAEAASDTVRPEGGGGADAGQIRPSGDSDTTPAGDSDAARVGGAEPTGPVNAAGGTVASPEPAPPARRPATKRARKAPATKATPAKRTTPTKKATTARKAAPSAARAPDGTTETANQFPTVTPEPATGANQGATPAGPEPAHTATADPETTTTKPNPEQAAPTNPGTTAVGPVPEHTASAGPETTTTKPQPEQAATAEPNGPGPEATAIADPDPEVGYAVAADLARQEAASHEPESGRTSGEGWRAVCSRVLAHPGFAPELLALASVEELGPRARAWAERTRRAYPDAGADGLARLATRRFVRLAGTGGALAAGAGLLAPVTELVAVLWTQASLVLHLAAVYGRDPGHPDRVAELLVLTQVHPDVGTARAALDAVRSAGPPVDGPWPRAAEAAWRLATPLAAQAGGWLGLRLASRLLPGAAVLTAAAGDSAAAERLAARATTLYRPVRAR